MKKRVLLGIVAAGLAVGLGGASQICPKQTRAERMADLFHGICLAPALTGDSPDALFSSLARTHDEGTAQRWIDTQSGSFLRVAATSCTVSTYAPHALTFEEAEELLELTGVIVARDFPQLVYDPKAVMGDEALAKGWFIGSFSSPGRWGIYHFAYPDWGDSAGSSLSFKAPPTPD